ncbi:expressed unknown protein [Seminavis robusta]|uniref:RING-type domain-containing protein n=1 Tax=Seminavis robusta TaxID=568900 RepID=A0A9N8H491_9STRA|nr:expressed unknown protein [Seminavis robusta]|eukprot:Sro5_g004570.1 n/a (1077) ;mRNA; f:188414-191852
MSGTSSTLEGSVLDYYFCAIQRDEDDKFSSDIDSPLCPIVGKCGHSFCKKNLEDYFSKIKRGRTKRLPCIYHCSRKRKSRESGVLTREKIPAFTRNEFAPNYSLCQAIRDITTLQTKLLHAGHDRRKKVLRDAPKMATFHKCPNCQTEFTTESNNQDAMASPHAPIVGICGHTFCLSCFFDMHAAALSQTRQLKYFRCLTCKREKSFHSESYWENISLKSALRYWHGLREGKVDLRNLQQQSHDSDKEEASAARHIPVRRIKREEPCSEWMIQQNPTPNNHNKPQQQQQPPLQIIKIEPEDDDEEVTSPNNKNGPANEAVPRFDSKTYEDKAHDEEEFDWDPQEWEDDDNPTSIRHSVSVKQEEREESNDDQLHCNGDNANLPVAGGSHSSSRKQQRKKNPPLNNNETKKRKKKEKSSLGKKRRREEERLEERNHEDRPSITNTRARTGSQQSKSLVVDKDRNQKSIRNHGGESHGDANDNHPRGFSGNDQGSEPHQHPVARTQEPSFHHHQDEGVIDIDDSSDEQEVTRESQHISTDHYNDVIDVGDEEEDAAVAVEEAAIKAEDSERENQDEASVNAVAAHHDAASLPQAAVKTEYSERENQEEAAVKAEAVNHGATRAEDPAVAVEAPVEVESKVVSGTPRFVFDEHNPNVELNLLVYNLRKEGKLQFLLWDELNPGGLDWHVYDDSHSLLCVVPDRHVKKLMDDEYADMITKSKSSNFEVLKYDHAEKQWLVESIKEEERVVEEAYVKTTFVKEFIERAKERSPEWLPIKPWCRTLPPIDADHARGISVGALRFPSVGGNDWKLLCGFASAVHSMGLQTGAEEMYKAMRAGPNDEHEHQIERLGNAVEAYLPDYRLWESENAFCQNFDMSVEIQRHHPPMIVRPKLAKPAWTCLLVIYNDLIFEPNSGCILKATVENFAACCGCPGMFIGIARSWSLVPKSEVPEPTMKKQGGRNGGSKEENQSGDKRTQPRHGNMRSADQAPGIKAEDRPSGSFQSNRGFNDLEGRHRGGGFRNQNGRGRNDADHSRTGSNEPSHRGNSRNGYAGRPHINPSDRRGAFHDRASDYRRRGRR